MRPDMCLDVCLGLCLDMGRVCVSAHRPDRIVTEWPSGRTVIRMSHLRRCRPGASVEGRWDTNRPLQKSKRKQTCQHTQLPHTHASAHLPPRRSTHMSTHVSTHVSPHVNTHVNTHINSLLSTTHLWRIASAWAGLGWARWSASW